MLEQFTDGDRDAVAGQLKRKPRAVAGVGYRCPCGKPAVLVTAPRLPDGTPFPTTYYLTCPRATAACSRVEVDGRMVEMAARLGTDEQLAAAYRSAHQAYLEDRAAIGSEAASGEDAGSVAQLSSADVPEIAGISAGGMPDRVKCLHALAAHALATGPGVNPLGDEVVEEIGEFWQCPCGPDMTQGEGTTR